MHTRREMIGGVVATALAFPAEAADPGRRLVAAARRQIGVTREYDSAYRRIAYPFGDIPRRTGVCSDVVVRAARDAWGVDLQQLVHEDMRRAFGSYPQSWGLKAPDPNIDHRRVPNLEAYWRRQGALVWHVPAAEKPSGAAFPRKLLPGDILTWSTALRGRPHVAIVSAGGWLPRIVHNNGAGTRETPLLMQWLDSAKGHYRWRPKGRR